MKHPLNKEEEKQFFSFCQKKVNFQVIEENCKQYF